MVISVRCERLQLGEWITFGRKKEPFFERNKSTVATWPDNVPIATGAFKTVYRGHYTEGPRNGKECVCKAFTANSESEKQLFEDEARISDRAKEIITYWNRLKIIDQPVLLNIPEIWDIGTSDDSSEKRLVEPFIDNFEKFNEQSHDSVGAQGTLWADALQALSHFSYHWSSGGFVLCDIQGGIYKNKL
ncbi:hypothetical protein DHEL01_v205290 [Diaporthe helianthi]|uniref:Alpha-type protein kinase domain-containing protein n=1 Tax=Diaporthe helianthi TaxID=158607 RepID=A0A2P5I1F3_DIAHE|nr:hypothetical protein DHEL01_v205290 [Diaporthe helianthi]